MEGGSKIRGAVMYRYRAVVVVVGATVNIGVASWPFFLVTTKDNIGYEVVK
ncbi:hypothetical protein FGF1_03340 [Flavobacteriaceae bacterium GF1]